MRSILFGNAWLGHRLGGLAWWGGRAGLVSLLLVWLMTDGVCAEAQVGRRPNVVVIVADDLGWRDPGFMGSDYHRTPNLDRLASEGMVFRQAYANAAVCAPTRAAVLTGMYASRTGVYTVGGDGGGRGGGAGAGRGAREGTRGDRGDRVEAGGRAGRRVETQVQPDFALLTPTNVSTLDAAAVTLPEALRDAGYATGHVGKWHLGRPEGEDGPMTHGFEFSVGATRGGGTRTYFAPYGIGSLDGVETPEGEYLTDRLTDEAMAFVEAEGDGPFFLWLAHYALHTPIEAEPNALAEAAGWPKGRLHNHTEYAAMLSSLDAGVGRLLDKLDALGLAKNTVVVFVSDNGGGRRVTRMDPLSGFKGSLQEGGLRVPCVVRWPGKVAAGSVSEEPVLLFDLYPTVLELAGVDTAAAVPSGQAVDGVSWVSLLLNGTRGWAERELVWYVPVYQTSPSGRVRANPSVALRFGKWKLLHDFESGASRLFDLERDVSERDDRAGDEPGVLAMMERRMQAWLKATGADVPRAR
ncbi:MAG: sulfatase [Planctomycetota bacterium]